MNFITLDNAYKAIEKVKKLNYVVDISLPYNWRPICL